MANSTTSVDEWLHYVYGSLLLISCLAGLLINGLVAFVFVRQNQLKTTNCILVFSLCVGGVLSSLTGTPFVTASSFFKKWIFGDIGCTWYAFWMTALGVFNIVLLTLAAFERFIMIVKTEWKKNFTKPISIVCVLISAIYSIMWALFPVFGWNEYTLEAMDTACSITWESNDPNNLSYCMVLFFVAFVIPMTLISVSYIAIFLKIRKQRKRFHNTMATIAASVESRIAVTTFLMIAGFVVAWGPYAFFSLWSAFDGPEDISPQLAAIPAVIAKMSVFWNPLIYLYTNGQFRTAFSKEFPRLAKLFSSKISPAEDIIQCDSGFIMHTPGLTPRGPTLRETVMPTVPMAQGGPLPHKQSVASF